MSQLWAVKFLFCFSAVLILVQHEVDAVCQLTQADLAGENRFVIRRDGNRGPELLRTDRVNSNSRLEWVCDANNRVPVVCNGNQFQPRLPIGQCASPLRPNVQMAARDGGCSANLYSIGFAPQTAGLNYYTSCYDSTRVRAHYVIHTLYAVSLSINRGSAFTLDGVITGADAATFDAPNVYNRFIQLLGPNQQYVTNPRQYVIHRGHLAPSADFLYAPMVVGTYKYVNVVPMFGSINQGNWRRVEEWVRREVHNVGQFRILTGAMDVLSLPNDRNSANVPMYLGTNNRNPIPKFVYKLVVNNAAGIRVAFVVYNNRFATRNAARVCAQYNCPATINLLNNGVSGFMHCCDVTDFLNRHLPNVRL